MYLHCEKARLALCDYSAIEQFKKSHLFKDVRAGIKAYNNATGYLRDAENAYEKAVREEKTDLTEYKKALDTKEANHQIASRTIREIAAAHGIDTLYKTSEKFERALENGRNNPDAIKAAASELSNDIVINSNRAITVAFNSYLFSLRNGLTTEKEYALFNTVAMLIFRSNHLIFDSYFKNNFMTEIQEMESNLFREWMTALVDLREKYVDKITGEDDESKLNKSKSEFIGFLSNAIHTLRKLNVKENITLLVDYSISDFVDAMKCLWVNNKNNSCSADEIKSAMTNKGSSAHRVSPEIFYQALIDARHLKMKSLNDGTFDDELQQFVRDGLPTEFSYKTKVNDSFSLK